MASTVRITGALIVDTMREASARMIFWGFYGLSTLLILFFLFLLRIDIIEGASATLTLFGQELPRKMELTRLVKQIYGGIAVFLYGVGMYLAVFAAAGLIPTVMEPGRIELLLSKPVGRAHLLLGRYVGAVLVVAINVAYLVCGIWLILGYKTGIWGREFLLAIPANIFMLAVLLTIVVVVSVLWENTAVATMVAFGVMLMSPILAQHALMRKLLSSEWSRQVWMGLFYVLPKPYDVGRVTMYWIRGEPTWEWMPFWSSAAFGAAMMGVGVILFRRKDY
jgi:ABC-type transport system involved in multi-copper enzyme maturation permease subunit